MGLDAIAERLAPNSATRDALRAWLEFGVSAGVLRCSNGRYAIRSRLARRIADPENDALAAFIQELAQMDGPAVLRMPVLLSQGKLFTIADQQGEIVARSSRITEPLIFEAIDAIVPRRGAFRVLDVGCGSGTYMRHSAERNQELTAMGIELQPDVAAFALDNLSKWGVGSRTAVESGDIRARPPNPEFDLVMLNNNIYYFGVAERPDLIRHLRGFLRANGRLLLTTPCPSRNVFYGILDLWSAGTAGWGRLPEREELLKQMRQAGFSDVSAKSLIPGAGYYAFVGR